jgi:hypothetical protein
MESFAQLFSLRFGPLADVSKGSKNAWVCGGRAPNAKVLIRLALDVASASAPAIAYPYSIMYAKRGTSAQDAMT